MNCLLVFTAISLLFTSLLLWVQCCEAEKYEFDVETLAAVRRLQEALVPLAAHQSFLVTACSSVYLPVRADGLCSTHSLRTLESVLRAEPWAVKRYDPEITLLPTRVSVTVIDAASKLPAGLLDGRIQDLGNYDQCLRVEEPTLRFRGKHCLVEAWGLLPDQLDSYFRSVAVFSAYPWGFVTFSMCVPSSCNPQDVITHLDRTLDHAGLNISVDKFEIFCSTNDRRQFRTKDWVAVGVYSIIALLVVFSTWYESNNSGRKGELMSSFSLLSNWKELTDTRTSAGDISCLHGLRVFLGIFVLVTHRVMVFRFTAVFNLTTYLEVKDNPRTAILWSAALAAETFFLISGTVRGYNFLMDRHNGTAGRILRQCILRYFRVTPAMAAVILFTLTLNIHLSNGPVWEKVMGYHELFCHHLWWANLLHISNCLGISFMCRMETWFLAADFQMFVLSPLLLLPLWHRPKFGLLVLAGVYVFSTTLKAANSFLKEIHPEGALYDAVCDLVSRLLDRGRQGDRRPSVFHLYTIYRVASFVLGLAVGFLILEARSGRIRIILSKFWVWLGWLLSTTFLGSALWFSTLFLRPSYEDTPWLSAVYHGLMYPLWVLAVAWVVTACTLGYGGWLNKFLSWSGFIPLARLSYGIYLTHVSLQSVQVYRQRQPVNMDTLDIMFCCIGDYTISAGLATVLYLAVEAPCFRITRHLFNPRAVSSNEDFRFKGLSRSHLD